MFSYLARSILVALFIVTCHPTFASVRPPGAPTPQEIARAQHHDDKYNAPEIGKLALAALDRVLSFVSYVWGWLNNNTGVLTFLLTCALVWVTSKLAQTTRTLSQVTAKVANAADKSALAARQSADTATNAFTKLERPYLLISGVTTFETDTGDPRLYYTVGNYGKTPAIIEDVQILISSGREPEIPLRADESNKLFQRRILGPSEVLQRLYEHAPHYITIPNLADPRPKLPQGTDLFFWIKILYRGAFTRNHGTSACWIWYRPENVFIRYGQDDDEYNYVQ